MMKTARKFHTGEQDCSCTSCLYKSASDNPSLGRFIAQGSRVDRLYYGKYIPLRERKLLERLVRTRAVYDDIRAQLISDSTISLSTKANSKPKNKLSSKEINDTEKGSGGIIELVDMVDKGATLGLSECCSCCSCSSKGFFRGHRTKHHRSYVGSRRQVLQKERLDVHRKKKIVHFKAKHIRSDPCTCTFKFSGLFKNNKKDLKKNMELIDFQPITNERPIQKRVREVVRRSYENIKQSNKQIEEKMLEGIEKLKESKTNIQERLNFDAQASAVKLKQTTNKLKSKNKTIPAKRVSKANLQLNDLLNICMCPTDQIFGRSSKESLLDIYKRKSKEKLIQARNNLKSAMKSTMERKPKATNIKTKTLGTHLAPDNDIALQIKKDSIRKFQEELRRKQIMKDWECEPECIEDTCVPDECYIKLKNKRKNIKHRGLEHYTKKHEKNTGIVLNHKNEKIQKNALTVQNKNTNQKGTAKKKDVKLIPKEEIVTPTKKSSFRQGVRIKSSYSFDIEFYKEKPNIISKESAIPKPTKSGINYKITKNSKCYCRPKNTQVVLKHSSRDTQTEKRSLKRCFCTLKLKSKKSKYKHKKIHKITTVGKSITTLEPPVAPCRNVDCSVKLCDAMQCEKLVVNKISNAHTNTADNLNKKRDIKRLHLLPFECEPGVCTPGDCDPYECIKLMNIREARLKERAANCVCSRKTKSTSTFTSRSNKASKAKIAQSLYSYGTTTQKSNEVKPKMERRNVHNPYGRQAVKIGSTFSFNIEFYKNKSPEDYAPPFDLKSFVVKPKLQADSKSKLKERAYQGDIASVHKNMPTQMYKKKRDAAISTSLKKCFCTLKLQRKSHSKFKRIKMFSTGTETIEEPLMNIITITKGTKIKQKYMQSLKPYECEPFICIPGQCNAYECLERINRRNLRDMGVSSTFNRSEINKGSSTSEKSLKAIKTQSKPRSREQKILTKVKKPKKQTQTFKEKVSYTSSAPSKQAVKIGSTFSFNIEFYKNKLQKQELKMNYETRPDVKLDTRPITKNQGVKIVKLNVANFDTQVKELRKHNKASTTKPLLKRCFCTLNLQKRKNNTKMSSVRQSQVYTVNTAMVKQKRLSIFKTHCTQNICSLKTANTNINRNLNGQSADCVIKSLYNECRRLNDNKHLQRHSYPLITNTNKLEIMKSNFYTALKLISQSYISDNLKLNRMGNQQHIKDTNNGNQYSPQVNQEKKCVLYTSNNLNRETKHLSGLRQYLKRNFCTMHLQVARNKYTEKKTIIYSDIGNQSSYKHRKLKPYECEPGVCVPGECDPYECLKLISKRHSNFSKKTGTESTVTSTSSHTNRYYPKYKSYKVQSPSQKRTKPQVTRFHKDQHKLGDKKAVRIGSTFSFDIEFFKKSGSPQIVKNKITSKLSSVTKPSHPRRTNSYLTKTTGMNKLNFRNRHSQSTLSKTLQKTSATLPRMKRCFCTLKLQKIGRLQKKERIQPSESLQTDPLIPPLKTTDRGQKSPKFKSPLKIQPLEPYECPPGICVPDQCNPYECLEMMKKLNYNQTTDSGTDAITGESKTSASMTASDLKYKTRKVSAEPKVFSRNILSGVREKKRVQPTNPINTTKQVVRIGSNFSFNIEFHKSQPSLDYPTENVFKKLPTRRQEHNKSDFRKRNIKIKQRSSETSTAMRHQHSQFKSTVQAASTMTTSFMKRCFCVLNLRKNKKKKIDNSKVAEIINKPVNVNKKTNTRRYKKHVLQLEPYECEPGICIPGECDPYVCEKIIKRRHLRSQSSSTAYNTRSASSSGSPSTRARCVNTQFRPKKNSREIIKQVDMKTKVLDSKRQVVKIGSNFSFDIEFYKNKASKLQDNEIIRRKKKKLLPSSTTKVKQKKSGTKNPSVSFRSQKSQIKVSKTDFAAGFNNVIKRCFCTLQLYNQRTRKDDKSKEKKIKPIENEDHSKHKVHYKNVTDKNKINSDSLESYECDPYECENLIKLGQRKQHLREIGMSTQHSDKQSAGSLIEPFKRTKKRSQSIWFNNKENIQQVKSFKRIQEAQSKQCVKIGSSFSFNIEFCKNKNAAGLQLDQKPQYRLPKLEVPKVDKVRKPKTRTQGLQSQKKINTSPSQMENEFMKNESTMTRSTPPLKRCFCTFYLKRPKKELSSIPKPITSNVSTETKLCGSKGLPITKLLPYECEPNICIPGECNPLECLERINARLKQQKNSGTSTQPLHRNEFGSSMLLTKTRNRRSQLKSTGHVKQTHQQAQRTEVNTNFNAKAIKQAVGIGSNFSFNIEFYKQRGLDHFDEKVSDEHKHKSVNKPLNKTNNNKQVNKKLYHNMQQNRGNQSQYIKQSSKSSAVESFYKRCFCILKLQKKPATTKSATTKSVKIKPEQTKVTKTTLKSDTNNVKTLSKPKIVLVNEGTFTKKYKKKIELEPYECEPNTCIPGECDPYECLKRIQARNLKNKTTQILRPIAKKSVGMNLADMYSKKMQSNFISSLPNKSEANQSNVVEIPRFGNLFNKQAVKIGSNFSFNVEFYKEILPPRAETHSKVDKIQRYEETRPKKLKKYTDSVNTSTLTRHHNKGIQGYGVKTDSKALEVGKALKRCFCTLKLQKELNSNQSKSNIQNPQFPQIIEVRRVSVKNNKRTLTEVKSIGTKTKVKYINASCNPQTCRDYKILKPEEMKVICPYIASKFNRKPSKTIQNKDFMNNKTNTKPRKTKISNRGKRLTKKKSISSIHKNHLPGEDINPSHVSLSNFKKFMCRCAQLFSHKTELRNSLNSTVKQMNYQNENENFTYQTKSDQRSHRYDFDKKKIKSGDNKRNQNKITNYTNQNLNSYYQAADISQNPTMSLKMIKKHQIDNIVDSVSHKKQNMVKESGHQKKNEKSKEFQENSPNETEDLFCVQCLKINKRHSQPLKVHFQDTQLNRSVDQIDKYKKNVQKNNINTDKQSRKMARFCNYCITCGAKLNNEEIQKAAGDQKSLKNKFREKTLSQRPKITKTAAQKEQNNNATSDEVIKTKCMKKCCFYHCQQQQNNNTSASDKKRNLSKSKQFDDIICNCKESDPPLFEMHLDSDNYGILNKEDVIDKVTKLSKKTIKDRSKNQHSYKSCRCNVCQCRNNKSGATFNFTPKGSKGKGNSGKPSKRTPSLPPKPCVCGSEICAKERASIVKWTYKPKHKRKRCYCGSPICASETKKINVILGNKDNLTCICEKERIKKLAKANAKKLALENKNRIARLKKIDAEDETRNKIRRKSNKLMEKKLNKNSSDLILAAESLIDVGKLGITACGDILRLLARTAIDPKHAYNNLKAMKESPELLAKLVKSGIKGSELTSTCRRIRLRCLSMQGIKNIRSTLERYAFTNYLLYMFHKDPSKRIPKRRPREREQLDFNCSLYMGSLRKRPYLCIYNKCPWFYPHFLSLLNVWKQFMEIALFLLAVVVWSPCILCMEACRACMCCFFCTG